jgi:hypothetical protein
MPTISIWQVGQEKALNFQVCTEPNINILFLIYTLLKSQILYLAGLLKVMNFE